MLFAGPLVLSILGRGSHVVYVKKVQLFFPEFQNSDKMRVSVFLVYAHIVL
eukprot:SAG11_NODE_26566_length_343_cov_1.209016_1_plen_51_part_00